MEWQRITALWQQDWMDMDLDQGLNARDYEKYGGNLGYIFLGALILTLWIV
jgi:hypothetical protein